MFDRKYGGIIWTNHALERLGQRGLSQELAWQAYRYPDTMRSGKERGTTEFQKKIGNSTITLIAKKNENNEWIVLSNWIDPPLPGTIDYFKKRQYKEYQKAGFWKKLWLIFRSQLGF